MMTSLLKKIACVCLIMAGIGSVLAQPVNDAFSSAIVISSNTYSERVLIVGATGETGEPTHAGGGSGSSAWWTFTVPSDGRIRVVTSNSDFDTILAAYTGSAVNALTEVQSNDDGGFGFGALSQLHFLVTAGEVLHFAVDAFDVDFLGTVESGFEYFPNANNDLAANALLLPGNAGITNVTNFRATRETWEATHSVGDQGGASVWFVWTAPMDISTTFSTAGSLSLTGAAFDTNLAVYTGDPSSQFSLVQRKQDDDSGGNSNSKLSIDVQQGTTYYIAVDGAGGQEGNITLCYSLNIPAMLGSVVPQMDGSMKVELQLQHECRVRLEASNDLSQGQAGWSVIASFSHQNGSVFHTGSGAIGQSKRFYRLVNQ